jgi:hypothetical protein
MTLIYILILLFVLLIGYQTYLALIPKKLIEGLTTEGEEEQTNTTQSYNVSEPNSSVNIEEQSSSQSSTEMSNDVKKKFNDIQLEIDQMQTQIDSLVQQQADYAQELAGSTPPDITGTDEETVENVEASLNNTQPNQSINL